MLFDVFVVQYATVCEALRKRRWEDSYEGVESPTMSAVSVGSLRIANPVLLLTSGLMFSLSGCGDLLGSGGSGGPPALELVAPAAGETAVSVLAPVTLHFSKAVDPATISGAVSLWNGVRRVVLTPSLANKSKVVVLRPADPLDFGTDYRVMVSEALTFRGGSALPQEETWEFRTEGLAPPIPDQDSLWFHLEALAHDSMRGRGSGSVDELRAAEYLRDRYMAYGLQEPPGGVIQGFEAYSRRWDSILTSRNVLAAVEGSGVLAQEWVVVGAHYDHVGFRNLADEGHGPNNGADDNGSGTVLILEMARLLQAYVDEGGMGSRDRRSVLFAAFGAEEQGLLGSCSYVHGTPAVPLVQTRAMMNLDMVGRLRSNTVYLSGLETSWVWKGLITNSNEPTLDLALSQSSCTGCTDHVCFWQAGIPFVGFFTGLHDEYHGPGDDVGLINFPGMGRIGELALRILNRLVVMPEAPPLTGAYPSSG